LLRGYPASSQQRVKAIIVQKCGVAPARTGAGLGHPKGLLDRAAYKDKVIPGFISIEGAKVRTLVRRRVGRAQRDGLILQEL
jgi:hypothetical protein